MKISNISIHYFLFTLLFLFPAFKWTAGGTALGQKLLHFTMLTCFLMLIIAKLLTVHGRNMSFFSSNLLRKHLIFGGVFFGIMSCYALFILAVIAPSPSVSGLSDIVRPIIYGLYFSIPLLFPIKLKQVQDLTRFLFLFIAIQIIFSMLVYFPETWWLVDAFKGRMSDDILIYHFFRWSGTFVYPSDFSFMLSFGIYYCFYIVSRNIGTRQVLKYTAMLLFMLIAVVMTLSRGGLASIIVVLVFFYFFTKVKRSIYINSILVFISVVIIAGFLYLYNSKYSEELNLDYMTASFDSEGPDASTLHRLKEFELAVDYSTNYFPFGVGGHREELKKQVGVIESFYGHNLIRGGWIGLLLNLFFVIYIVINGLRAIGNNDCVRIRAFLWGAILVIVSVPLVFGFSSAMSDRFKTLPFYYLLCGYCIMITVQGNTNISKKTLVVRYD